MFPRTVTTSDTSSPASALTHAVEYRRLALVEVKDRGANCFARLKSERFETGPLSKGAHPGPVVREEDQWRTRYDGEKALLQFRGWTTGIGGADGCPLRNLGRLSRCLSAPVGLWEVVVLANKRLMESIGGNSCALERFHPALVTLRGRK